MEKVESKEKMRNLKKGDSIKLPISSLETIRNNVSLLNAKHLLEGKKWTSKSYPQKGLSLWQGSRSQLNYTIMERVLTELTPECEVTARMYAQGYEKKEIASMKCRAISTINNQLQKAFEVLQVRNGRELATMLYERITGAKFTMDFSPVGRAVVACCLLCVFSLSLYHEQSDMRRSHRTRVETLERIRRSEWMQKQN